MDHGSEALGRAWGHVRNAAAAFLTEPDPTDEGLFLAAECVDVEGLFTELGVVPEVVEDGLDAVGSLEQASEALASVRAVVPLAVWSAVQVLLARARS